MNDVGTIRKVMIGLIVLDFVVAFIRGDVARTLGFEHPAVNVSTSTSSIGPAAKKNH